MSAPTITIESPFIFPEFVVPEAWIDVNQHMNATFYGLAIYDAHVLLTEKLGLADDYVAARNMGKVVLASQIVYEREVAAGDVIEIHSWLLAVDHKRLHFFHELYNKTKGVRAATGEQVDMHVDLQLRRSCPFPDDKLAELQAVVRAHTALPRPQGVGATLRPPINNWL